MEGIESNSAPAVRRAGRVLSMATGQDEHTLWAGMIKASVNA